MKRGHFLLIGGASIAVILSGAILARRLRHERSSRATPAVHAIPDLSRWPAEFSQRVASLEQNLSKGKQPNESRGQLATLYFANGYTEEAEKKLRELCRTDPANPHWPYFLGNLRLHAGDKKEAESFFAQVIRLDPAYGPALYRWGDLIATSGRSEEAKNAFEQALKLSPDDSWILYSLAKLDHARGDDGAAQKELESLAIKHPEFQEAHQMLAGLLEKMGDLQRSQEQRSYLREGKASPPLFDPWMDEMYLQSYDTYRLEGFAEARMEGNQFEAALPFLRRALALDPHDVNLRDELAKTLSDLRRYPEASTLLKEGLDQNGDTSSLQIRMAEIMVLENRGADAATLLQQAIEKFPKKPALYIALGKTLLQLNRAEEAAAACREALRLNPTLVAAHLNLGRAWRILGRPEEAKAELEQALKMRPDGTEVLGTVASFELENHDLDAAEIHAQQLVALEPTKAESRGLLGQIKLQKGAWLAQSGRTEEAEKVYLEGLGSDDSSGQLHGALGMLYGKQQRLPEAMEQFKRYLALSPNDPFGYVLLGTAYQGVGDSAHARETWTQGLAVAQKAASPRAAQLQQLLNSLPP